MKKDDITAARYNRRQKYGENRGYSHWAAAYLVSATLVVDPSMYHNAQKRESVPSREIEHVISQEQPMPFSTKMQLTGLVGILVSLGGGVITGTRRRHNR